MLNKLKNWLNDDSSKDEALSAERLKKTGRHLAPRKNTSTAPRPLKKITPGNTPTARKDNDLTPGETAPRRNRLIREDTGTHETVKIIDRSLPEPDEDDSFDPYNTGGFDRSKNWKSRF